MRKVEQAAANKDSGNSKDGEPAKDGSSGTQTDVASILARRVAVEMSDSDDAAHSDSEYDSDDWGDENTA